MLNQSKQAEQTLNKRKGVNIKPLAYTLHKKFTFYFVIPNLMKVRDQKRFVELLLYILNRTGRLDSYHVFKILYFAERLHVATWGLGFVPDNFLAKTNGPVPENLSIAIEELSKSEDELSKLIDALTVHMQEKVEEMPDGKDTFFEAKREADMNYISKADKDVLDSAISDYAHLPFLELRRLSHDEAWEEADKRVNGTDVLSPVTMAKAMKVDEAMLDYVREQCEIAEYFS